MNEVFPFSIFGRHSLNLVAVHLLLLFSHFLDFEGFLAISFQILLTHIELMLRKAAPAIVEQEMPVTQLSLHVGNFLILSLLSPI